MTSRNRIYDKSEEKLEKYYLCKDKYEKAVMLLLKGELSEGGKHDMLINGRVVANYILHIYNTILHTKSLSSFLEVSNTISGLYPNIVSTEELSEYELFYIRDKCKSSILLIFVYFHLNLFDLAEKELADYKTHIGMFRKHGTSSYEALYENMKELLTSFRCVNIYNDHKHYINIFNRIGFQAYEELECGYSQGKKLNRAVIVGSCATQITLKDTTIDMFRISQAIQYKIGSFEGTKIARKWLFYNSPFWEVEISITDALHTISDNGIMLIYLSGDAYEKKSECKNSLFQFGVKMKQEADENVEHSKVECLYPGDIVASLIVPMVLIVDSECSQSFKELYRHTDEPFMCLLSPTKYPAFIEKLNSGKLFTLFLTSPQTAFCLICQKYEVREHLWLDLVHVLNDFMLVLTKVVHKWLRKPHSSSLSHFLDDHFCNAFLLRYLFCLVSLRLHNDFSSDSFYPSSNLSSLEKECLANMQLQSIIYRMASIIGASDHFATSCDLSSIDVGI